MVTYEAMLEQILKKNILYCLSEILKPTVLVISDSMNHFYLSFSKIHCEHDCCQKAANFIPLSYHLLVYLHKLKINFISFSVLNFFFFLEQNLLVYTKFKVIALQKNSQGLTSTHQYYRAS